MDIPFSPPYINEDIEDEVISALRSGWITSGPKVKALEELLQQSYNIPNVIACNSGTSSLELAFHWYGISKGDEVIIPAYTYVATALAVLHVGATPVFVDSGDDFNMDVAKLRTAITEKTKAIIPVDIGGWPADYDNLKSGLDDTLFISTNDNQKKLGRPLILADAAHSIGSKYKNAYIGNLADITIFSFHAVKNITTAEGGAICLNLPKPFNNSAVAKTLKLWRINGQTKDAFTKSQVGGWKYDIVYPGFKMNMPDVLAAIGLAQLRMYESELLPKRKMIFENYNKAFSKCTWAQLPPFDDGIRNTSCHLYMLRIKDINEAQRAKIIELISARGVAVNVHFIPLPMLTIFKDAGHNIKDYPVAHNNYAREITLPLYPQLTEVEVRFIIETVTTSVEEIIA
jgi:dTDP-4-amino-4,6-dideoxygalactose transaminase